MREIIQFENLRVEIWRRPRQRRMYLTVRDVGRVRVTCNRGKPRRDILGFVADNRAFIARRTDELEGLSRRYPPKRCLSGEEFLYLGQRLILDVIWSWSPRPRVRQTTSHLELVAPIGCGEADRRAALTAFYRRRARAHLTERVRELSARTGLAPRAVAIRGQRTRWGSCSSRGQISLNWKLMAAPPSVLDYVIYHELAHLKHMDHSANFWALVERMDPAWRASAAWLKANEPEINIQFGVDADKSR